MSSVGANAAAIRQKFAGRCVNTMVLTRPMRRASGAAASCDTALSSPVQKKNAPAAVSDMLEALEQPEREQRVDDEAAGERIDAEQAGELPHVAFDGPSGAGGLFNVDVRGGEPRIDAAPTDDADGAVQDEHQLQRIEHPDAMALRQPFRRRCAERADGAEHRADEAVAGEGLVRVSAGVAAASAVCSSG